MEKSLPEMIIWIELGIGIAFVVAVGVGLGVYWLKNRGGEENQEDKGEKMLRELNRNKD